MKNQTEFVSMIKEILIKNDLYNKEVEKVFNEILKKRNKVYFCRTGSLPVRKYFFCRTDCPSYKLAFYLPDEE